MAIPVSLTKALTLYCVMMPFGCDGRRQLTVIKLASTSLAFKSDTALGAGREKNSQKDLKAVLLLTL